MPKKRPPSTLQIGHSGLKQSAGRINEEFHRNLQGSKAAKVYEEMSSNDATVGAVLYSIESFLRKVDWRVEPGPDDTDGKEAEFLEGCMHDMEAPWEDFISDALSFLRYGYALHEVVYKIRVGPDEENPRYYSEFNDNRFGWRALALRPQTTIDHWDLDPESGAINGAYQTTAEGFSYGPERYLPMNRCVLFRTRPFKGNPEGYSILRPAYRSWYMKKRLEEIEAIGIARDLNGVPVIQVPPQIMSANATPAQRQTRTIMEDLVAKLHRDEMEGVVFPSELTPGETNVATGYKLELMTTNGGTRMLPDPVIRRYDARIAMSMAAEFIILGTEKQGSFALGAEKSANFIRSLHWYVDVIAAALNKGPVKRLYDVNGVPVGKRGKIVAGDLDKPDLMAFGTFLGALTSNGLLHPTPAVEEKLREIANLPAETEDLETLFEEEKAAKEEQRQLDAEVAMAGAQAKVTAAAGKAPAPGAQAAKPAAKPAAKKPAAKPAPKGKK